MASTIKYTLFNLILVVIIQQYISIQFPSKHKRTRRAVLQEETNHTAHTSFAHAQRLTHTLDTVSIDPSLSTIAFNTTLTSEERLQQLQKLKDAEMHLRKNLREKGKEYENQLYENWPKHIEFLKKKGPAHFDSKYYKFIMEHLSMSEDYIERNWTNIFNMFQREGKDALQTYIKEHKESLNETNDNFADIMDAVNKAKETGQDTTLVCDL